MNNVKNISIKNYLAARGITPTRETAKDGYYLSPLRTESSPSFHVSYEKNLWHDFGADSGGSIIDLVMQMDNCTLAEAYTKLKGADSMSVCNRPLQEYKRPESPLKIIDAIPLSNPRLIEYITSERAVDLEIAKHYCQEVHYKIGDKRLFAVGFRSDAGGWEFSASGGFKLSSSPKSPTTIDNGSDTCIVFEGFIDMLSYLTLKRGATPSVNIAVLNSVVNLGKAKDFLCRHQTLHCFMDNDRSGKQALAEIKSWGIKSIDHSSLYQNFNDVNEYLQSIKLSQSVKPAIQPKRGRRM